MSNRLSKAIRWYSKLFGRTLTKQAKKAVYQDKEFKQKLLRDWRTRNDRR